MPMGKGYPPYEGGGAAKSKGGGNMYALDRPAGYRETVSAMKSKTRSRYPASSENNKWKDCSCGYGSNEHVVGYSHGNGGY